DLPIEAVDPGLFEVTPHRRAVWMNDLAAFEETAAFCRRVGCGLVLVGALAEPGMDYEMEAAASVLRKAGAGAAKAGLRLAVRNTVEGACASGETLAALLEAVAHVHVGAAWSPADALEAGHDPHLGLQALRGQAAPVFLVSVRDGVREEGAWRDCTPGEGAVGWAAHLAELNAMAFDGPLVLDVRGAPRPKAGLREATALIHLLRSARRAS
ncbi:MAG: sugar phosphate isomerase/epimerase, partial [Rhodothermaceae bacterium]|nr:sugar phosphate isomerase/epimerase [Rhodothermaceae bacterium]